MRNVLMADDPTMFSLGVRLFVAVLLSLCFLLVYINDASPLNEMAVVGIFFGMGGAGLLYWETIMSDADCGTFESHLRDYIEGRFARILERVVMALFVLLGLYNMWPYIQVFGDSLVCGDGGPIILSRLLLSVAFGFAPALGAFLSIAAPRWYYNKITKGLDVHNGEEKISHIKKSVRQMGFISLVVAGFMQWPVLLWG